MLCCLGVNSDELDISCLIGVSLVSRDGVYPGEDFVKVDVLAGEDISPQVLRERRAVRLPQQVCFGSLGVLEVIPLGSKRGSEISIEVDLPLPLSPGELGLVGV